jgi:sRNA-binding carbon storage regulator CsrA
MLILTRRIGERVRITTPSGDIWMTMLDGAIKCDYDGWESGYASLGDACYFDIGQDTVEIRMLEIRSPSMGHRLGIEAPKDFAILREELIGKAKYVKLPMVDHVAVGTMTTSTKEIQT